MFIQYLINNLVIFSIFFWYNDKLFVKLKLSSFNLVVFLFLIIIKSILNDIRSFELNLIFTIIVYGCASQLFFKGSFIKKSVFNGFFLLSSFVTEMISFILLHAFIPLEFINQSSLLYYLIGCLISAFILFSIAYLVTKINDIKYMVESSGFWYFIIFPAISIVLIYATMQSELLMLNPTLSIMIIVGLIIFNIITCKGFTDIIKYKNIQIENEKFKSQELHYQLIEEKFDNSKRFIHDFKKHAYFLQALVSSKNYEQAEGYLCDLIKEVKSDDSLLVTGNQLIDFIINSKIESIQQHTINLKHDIKIKNVLPISDLDFNVVFSNILENAIESCIKSNGKFIKVKLDKINDSIILKISNSCDEIKSDFITTKNNTEYHGYGIETIKRVIQKYKGVSKFEFDKENRIFTTTVIFG